VLKDTISNIPNINSLWMGRRR